MKRILTLANRLLNPARIETGWRYLSYDPHCGTGYCALTWVKGMTPWHLSTERAFGLWSLSAHVPGLQFNVIGPFTKEKR